MYHRFPRQHEHNFDRQCAFLAANYNVVPLEEAAQRLRQDQPIANMAVITVDDGYADMHEVAFPILWKHRLPATLFVTTGFINRTSWMPGDRVRYHLAHTK
jgi:peptidoglycan/xylan/chitin deacetylase (PgdA/CDA1 family)